MVPDPPFQYTEKSVTRDPPLLLDSAQEKVIDVVLYETIARLTGELGTVAAIYYTASDRVDDPTEFLAKTLKE